MVSEGAEEFIRFTRQYQAGKVPREMMRRETALLAEDVRQTGIVVIGWSPEGLEHKVWILDHRLRFAAGRRPEWQVSTMDHRFHFSRRAESAGSEC
jgi:hypothetical protein